MLKSIVAVAYTLAWLRLISYDRAAQFIADHCFSFEVA